MTTNRMKRPSIRKKVLASSEDMIISQRAAQRLVGDPEIASAFEEIRDGYAIAWSETAPNEREKRDTAYYALKALTDVWGLLQRRANSANVRDKEERRQRDAFEKCIGCGVIQGELHKEGCQVLANKLRTMRLANG